MQPLVYITAAILLAQGGYNVLAGTELAVIGFVELAIAGFLFYTQGVKPRLTKICPVCLTAHSGAFRACRECDHPELEVRVVRQAKQRIQEARS